MKNLVGVKDYDKHLAIVPLEVGDTAYKLKYTKQELTQEDLAVFNNKFYQNKFSINSPLTLRIGSIVIHMGRSTIIDALMTTPFYQTQDIL